MAESRILLREHVSADVELFCDLQMDPSVARYVSWLPRTRAQCEAALADAIAQQESAERIRYFFAVAMVSTNEMVGSVGYTMTGASTADFGWFIRRPFWGKGYASEAVQLMLSTARGAARLKRVYASCDARNVGSVRVAERCGFRRTHQTVDRLHFELVL